MKKIEIMCPYYHQFKNALKTKAPKLWRIFIRARYPTAPIPLGLWILNVIIQRILQINGNTPWMVHFTSQIIEPKKIKIGTGVAFSFAVSGGCYIQGNNGIYIGEDTIFARNVCIISANHNASDLKSHLPERPIHIGKKCWIGANAVILPGVHLGDQVIVGAGSVVTQDFPDKSVIAGVPARILHTIE